MSDWRKCIPAMRIMKSMSLAKRNGPILVGLYLQEHSGNDSFTVVPYVHNLSHQTSSITLTINFPLINKRNTFHESFTLKSHDREFSDACRRLHAQTLFPLGEDLSLSQILRAYEIYFERKLGFATKSVYIDPVCYLTWCGKIDEAKRMVEKSITAIDAWEDRNFVFDGGKQVFLNNLAEIPENPDQLREICEEQIKILKVDKLPDYGLICN